MPEKISNLPPQEIAARFRELFDLTEDETEALLGKIAEQKKLGRKARKEMTTVRLDYLTRFQQKGEEPLAVPITVRLPVSIDEAIRALPTSGRNEWLRRVITKAAKEELLNE